MPNLERQKTPDQQEVELQLMSVENDFVSRDNWALKRVIGEDPSVADHERFLDAQTAAVEDTLKNLRAAVMGGLSQGKPEAKVAWHKAEDQALYLASHAFAQPAKSIRYVDNSLQNARASFNRHIEDVQAMYSAVTRPDAKPEDFKGCDRDTARRIGSFLEAKKKMTEEQIQGLASGLEQTLENMRGQIQKLEQMVDEKSLRGLSKEQREARYAQYEAKYERYQELKDEMRRIMKDVREKGWV